MGVGGDEQWAGESDGSEVDSLEVVCALARPRESDKKKTLAREGYGRNPQPEQRKLGLESAGQTTLTSTLPDELICGSSDHESAAIMFFELGSNLHSSCVR